MGRQMSLSVAISQNLNLQENLCKLERVENIHHHEKIITFIEDNFYPRESERKPIGIGHGAYSLVEEVPRLLNQGISVIAFDTTKDRIIGIAVNHVITADLDLLFTQPTTNVGVKAFRNCMKKIQDEGNTFKNKKVKRGINMFYVGVKEQLQRSGLPQQLVEHSVELARIQKFDFVQSITFSPELFRLFSRLEFEKVTSISLINQRVNGAQAFPNAGPDDHLYYVYKRL